MLLYRKSMQRKGLSFQQDAPNKHHPGKYLEGFSYLRKGT